MKSLKKISENKKSRPKINRAGHDVIYWEIILGSIPENAIEHCSVGNVALISLQF